jgi:putative Holliday junction resolvase
VRVLALDVGERRIGVAISTPEGGLSVPLASLARQGGDQDLRAVRELVDREGVDRVVVGMPLSLSGEPGRQAALTEQFVAALKASLPVPVDVWDERLSSVEAERRLTEGRSKRRRTSDEERGRVDSLAASIILQSYLDRLRRR